MDAAQSNEVLKRSAIARDGVEICELQQALIEMETSRTRSRIRKGRFGDVDEEFYLLQISEQLRRYASKIEQEAEQRHSFPSLQLRRDAIAF
ncbi:hypothetical protein ACLOJK_039076 [Asimina triloba]